MPRGRTVQVTGGRNRHYRCECGYTTSNKTGISLHMRVTHDDTKPKDLDRDADYLRCKICKSTFDNKFQLLTHTRHTGHIK